MKRIPKYIYEDKKYNYVHRRQNMTKPKIAILMALCRLDRDDAKADAYDTNFQERYYSVATIARQIYGDAAFDEDGKLKNSKRSGLNQLLGGLRMDGFITLTGRSRWYDGARSMREYWKYTWRLTSEGRRCLAASVNGCISQWMRLNRYVGENGNVLPSQVVKLTNTTHPQRV